MWTEDKSWVSLTADDLRVARRDVTWSRALLLPAYDDAWGSKASMKSSCDERCVSASFVRVGASKCTRRHD